MARTLKDIWLTVYDEGYKRKVRLDPKYQVSRNRSNIGKEYRDVSKAVSFGRYYCPCCNKWGSDLQGNNSYCHKAKRRSVKMELKGVEYEVS